MSDADYTQLESGDLLKALGDDAQKWAQAFCQITRDKKLLIDEGLMIAWFANAIEHSSDVRRWRREKEAADNKHVFHKDRSLEEMEANAQLMAAAPELLAAAKDAWTSLCLEFGNHIAEVNFGSLRAAIAKAEPLHPDTETA